MSEYIYIISYIMLNICFTVNRTQYRLSNRISNSCALVVHGPIFVPLHILRQAPYLTASEVNVLQKTL